MKILCRHAACLAWFVGLFLTLPITASPPQTSDRKQNQATGAPSPQELFKRLAPSVFVVEALNESGSVVAIGSGVAVAPNEVVTNKHVVEAGANWKIRQGNKTWTARTSHFDPDQDLCQLNVDGLRAVPVSVRISSTLTVGEHVYAIGAPEGLELTLSEGLISGLRRVEQVRLIQTSAAISPGSSGGGLFDERGRLVGITTFFLKGGQNLNFALPGERVLLLPEFGGMPPKPVCLWPEPIQTPRGLVHLNCQVLAPPASALDDDDKDQLNRMTTASGNALSFKLLSKGGDTRLLEWSSMALDVYRRLRTSFCARHPQWSVPDVDNSLHEEMKPCR